MAATEYVTLRDYARTYRISAYCSGCKQHAWLSLGVIAHQVGWDTELSAVKRALRCSQCGSGGAQISVIYDTGPPSLGIAFSREDRLRQPACAEMRSDNNAKDVQQELR